MVVHSSRVQCPAPHQGPHLLICGSPLPGKYAQLCEETCQTSLPNPRSFAAMMWIRLLFKKKKSTRSNSRTGKISRFSKIWKNSQNTKRSNKKYFPLLCILYILAGRFNFWRWKGRWATKGEVQARSHTCRRLVQAPSEDPDEKLS